MPLDSPGFIGRYVVFEELASGGMATVYLARSLDDPSRPVALKRLHPHFAKDPEFSAMFMDEARIALRLDHRNIVQTLDVVPTDGEIVIVLEYVHGASLASLVGLTRRTRRRVPPAIAVGVVAGILRGLHAAHEAKSEVGSPLAVVHRDVSPQNVLVGVDGAPRLIDFGIAKAMGRMVATREGALKGKLAYMAPEQARGDAITRRADLFSTGIVLWEALTGQGLFRSKNEAELLMKVLGQPIPSPRDHAPELPEALEAAVLRALAREPDERFATAREMADALAAALTPAPPEAIGAWVEVMASEALAERATLLDATAQRMASPVSLASYHDAASAPGAKLPPIGAPRRAPVEDVDDEAATRQLPASALAPRADTPPPSSPRVEGAPRARPLRAAARPAEPTPEERRRAALNARAGLAAVGAAAAAEPRPYDAGIAPFDPRLPRAIPRVPRDDDSLVARLGRPAAIVAAGLLVAVLDWAFRAQTASWAFRPGWVANALLIGGLGLGVVRALATRR